MTFTSQYYKICWQEKKLPNVKFIPKLYTSMYKLIAILQFPTKLLINFYKFFIIL